MENQINKHDQVSVASEQTHDDPLDLCIDQQVGRNLRQICMTRLATFTFYGRILGLHDKASFLIWIIELRPDSWVLCDLSEAMRSLRKKNFYVKMIRNSGRILNACVAKCLFKMWLMVWQGQTVLLICGDHIIMIYLIVSRKTIMYIICIIMCVMNISNRRPVCRQNIKK